MPKVRFNLKDGAGLILLKYRYRRGGLPFVYSFNRHCPPEFWNKNTMRVKVTNRFPQSKGLNELLQHLEDETRVLHDSLIAQGVQPSTKDFKNHLDTIMFRNVEEKMTLFKFIEQTITEKEQNASTNKLNTINNYKGLLKVLRRYSKTLGFDDINFRWLKKFEQWCYDNKYSTGTVSKFVALTKSTINKARKEGYTSNDSVKEHGFSVSAPKGNKICLYLDELAKIESIKWDEVESFQGFTRARLEKVADLILAGCWSGLRHSDLHKIRRSNIKTHDGLDMIEVWTKKKDVQVAIPIFDPLRVVLEKRNYSLPYASRSEVLRVGRAVLELAGVDSVIQWRDTKGGGLKMQMIPKHEKFASHVLRRSFATNAYLLGIDTRLIMQITGHATEQQLLDYVNVGKWQTVKYFDTLKHWRERLGLAA